MKRKIILSLAAAIILAALMALVSCSDGSPYGDYDDEGYTVSVKFDANGGTFAGRNEVYIVDVFHKDAGSIAILKPDDDRRGDSTTRLPATMSKHLLTGWFVDTLDSSCKVVDGGGNEITLEALKNTAWNFDEYRIITDKSKAYSSENPVLTLKAGWERYNTFEFYVKGEDGTSWTAVADKNGNPLVYEALTLEYPTKNLTFDQQGKYLSGNGDWKLGNYKLPANTTFVAAYLDEELTIPVKGDGESGRLNEEIYVQKTGADSAEHIKIYIDCKDGVWYDIYSAKQMSSIGKTNVNYNICTDVVDFEGIDWPFDGTSVFHGQITSENGAIIRGVSAKQATNANRTSFGGIFYSLGAKSVIKNITFEDVSYKITGSLQEASFGMLAGRVVDGATLENVAISGNASFVFTKDLLMGDGISSGLVSADGTSNPRIQIYLTVGSDNADIDISGANYSLTLSDDFTDDDLLELFFTYRIEGDKVVFTAVQNG